MGHSAISIAVFHIIPCFRDELVLNESPQQSNHGCWGDPFLLVEKTKAAG